LFETSSGESFDLGVGFGASVLCDLDWAAERLVMICREVKADLTRSYLDLMECNEFDEDDMEKLTELLVFYHDWEGDDIESEMGNLFIIYKSYKVHSRFGDMFGILLRVGQILLSNFNERKPSFLSRLDELVHEINTHLDEYIACSSVESVACLLALLVEKQSYRTHLALWKLCYRVAQLSDPTSVDELAKFYADTEDVRDRLPTPSLMLLREAHEKIGQIFYQKTRKTQIELYENHHSWFARIVREKHPVQFRPNLTKLLHLPTLKVSFPDPSAWRGFGQPCVSVGY